MSTTLGSCALLTLTLTLPAMEETAAAVDAPTDPEALPSGWTIQLRPHAGAGVTTVGNYQRNDGVPWGVAGLLGVRALTGRVPWFAVGVEGSWLSTGLAVGEGPRDLTLIGPVVEFRFVNLVHLSVGALWAKELNQDRRSYADGTLAMGFEPWADHRWSPLLVYRSDMIFTTSPTTVRTVMAGLRYTF